MTLTCIGCSFNTPSGEALASDDATALSARGCAEGTVCIETTNQRADACAEVSLELSATDVFVYLIVDQSWSMTWNIETGDGSGKKISRLDAVKDLILGPKDARGTRTGGLVRDFDQLVRIGYSMYGGNGDSNSCPVLNDGESAVVPAEYGNLTEIERILGPAATHLGTPSGEGIDAVTTYLKSNQAILPGHTRYIWLTDGDPTGCHSIFVNKSAHRSTADAIKRARDEGIATSVVGIAKDDSISAQRIVEYANLGAGLAADHQPPANYSRAGDYESLKQEVEGWIQSQRSCTFPVKGEIEDLANVCKGSVQLELGEGNQAVAIPCVHGQTDPQQGWRAIDSKTIELVGDSCDMLKRSRVAELRATFPCSVPVSLE